MNIGGFCNKFLTLLCLIMAIFLASGTQKSSAQTPNLEQNDLILKVSPENPGALETVSFSVDSYLFNINTSNITWLVDGKVVKSGIGANTFSVETKAIGKTTDVTVKVVAGINTITRTTVLRPEEIDVFFESASGYTPPFYRGRSLPTKDSEIRVVALPETSAGTSSMNPSGYSYTWKRGEAVLQNLSGYNKNSLNYYGDYLNPVEDINLTIVNTGGTYKASKKITIPLFEPELLIYENSPLRGMIYEREIGGNTNISTGEKTFVIEPYFMNVIGPTSSYLNYTWKVNGSQIQNPSRKNQLTVRSGGQNGNSLISVDIENITKLFEKASKSLLINLTN